MTTVLASDDESGFPIVQSRPYTCPLPRILTSIGENDLWREEEEKKKESKEEEKLALDSRIESVEEKVTESVTVSGRKHTFVATVSLPP